MSRLIDTMTNEKAHDLVEYLADVNVRVVEAIDVLEKLFAPVSLHKEFTNHGEEL
jgi:hypothetical protein